MNPERGLDIARRRELDRLSVRSARNGPAIEAQADAMECNYHVHFIVLGKVSGWGLDTLNLKI